MRTARLASAVVAALFAFSACGGGSTPGQGGAGPAATVNDAPVGGSCKVSVTGEATVSWTANQDMSSVMVSYWLSAANRKVLSLKDGEESLILNCKGTGGSVNFLSPTGTTSTNFPRSPKSYVIPVGGLLGGADPGQITMLFNLGDKALWKVTEAGTFNVTTFDGGKFAGTFSVRVGKVGDDLTTIVGTAMITGSFDMACPSGIGYACG